MNYIKKDDYKTILVSNNKEILIDVPLKRYLNNLLISELTTLDGRLISTKKIIGKKIKIPIYINENIMFIQIYSINGKNTLLLNYFMIDSFNVEKSKVIVYFNDNSKLEVYNKISFLSAIKSCKEVLGVIKK